MWPKGKEQCENLMGRKAMMPFKRILSAIKGVKREEYQIIRHIYFVNVKGIVHIIETANN